MPTANTQELLPDASSRREAGGGTARLVQQVIDRKLFAMHFQPIVDLRSHAIFAYEALCRPQDHFKSPVELISAAVETQKIGELGRLQRTSAVKNCSASALFVNLEPHEFDEPWLVRPDDPIFKHRFPVYLEITENVPLRYFDQCHSVLAELRKKGTLLVIDDLGAGFSNLKYIAELQPDIVKLDRDLISGCKTGTSEFSLLRSITELCHQMNARVVAEGIETVEELVAVIAAGADFGQGYLLARPALEPPPIEWPATMPLNEVSAPGNQRRSETGPPADQDRSPSSDRESDLKSEVRKLTELLVQSEMARLTLVRRLQAKAEAEPPNPAEEGTSAVEAAAGAPILVTEEEVPVADRPSRLPRLAVVIPLLVVLLIAWWAFSGNTVKRDAPKPQAVVSAEVPDPPQPATEEPVVVLPETDEAEPAAVADEPPDTAAVAPLIASRIDAWAEAWAEKRANDYLSFYSLSFETPEGESFADWSGTRRQRLARPAWISVVVSGLSITFPAPDRALATFDQEYSSPGYSDQVSKTQRWALESGQWRIVSESSEPAS